MSCPTDAFLNFCIKQSRKTTNKKNPSQCPSWKAPERCGPLPSKTEWCTMTWGAHAWRKTRDDVTCTRDTALSINKAFLSWKHAVSHYGLLPQLQTCSNILPHWGQCSRFGCTSITKKKKHTRLISQGENSVLLSSGFNPAVNSIFPKSQWKSIVLTVDCWYSSSSQDRVWEQGELFIRQTASDHLWSGQQVHRLQCLIWWCHWCGGRVGLLLHPDQRWKNVCSSGERHTDQTGGECRGHHL